MELQCGPVMCDFLLTRFLPGELSENIFSPGPGTRNRIRIRVMSMRKEESSQNKTEYGEAGLLRLLSHCQLCPRKCGVDRLAGERGYCRESDAIYAARAALHYWEEPCISGAEGSGTVFFSGCNMRCVFCQNHEIALGTRGQEITLARLAQIFLELQEKGANNINLVTPTHYLPQIVLALRDAKSRGLRIPIVYNSGGYEEVSSLQLLEGLVDIYLPDLKYHSSQLSARFSNAPDYFEKATAALQEMYRQVGTPLYDPETGLLKRGMIVRHLLLPGQTGDSKRILRWLHTTFGDHILISILSQYTPMPQLAHCPDCADLNRKVTSEEYERLLTFAQRIGIQEGFYQEGETAKESFIPPFTGEGL